MFERKGVTVVENPNTREPITEGEQYFKDRICSTPLFDGWTLYEQPIVNSMHPDFILSHREKGIFIIEVKDWHLDIPRYGSDGLIRGENGRDIKKNPVFQVKSYKELILRYEIHEFVNATENYQQQAQAMVTPIIYFHVAKRDRALDFCGYPNPKECLIWTRSDLDYLCQTSHRNDDMYPPCLFYQRSTFAKGPDQSMQKLVDGLDHILRPSDYARERSNLIVLTREQRNLVPIRKGSIRRWGGVAGSGKTLILASKAVEAIKSGHNVLLLTFNITLRHYIRDLCSQQFGEGDRRLLKSHLTISHFHGFLKILSAELGIQPSGGTVEEYTKEAMNHIVEGITSNHPWYLKYDCILIDEGQDFTGQWIIFLKNFFTAQGELLVMYDRAQSIYEDRGMWITDANQITGIGFRGQVGYLNVTQRLPENIVYQIKRLEYVLGLEGQEQFQLPNAQIDLFTRLQWINVPLYENRFPIIQNQINQVLSDRISTIDDITIITMKEETGIEIVNQYRKSFYAVSHVFDISGQRDNKNRRNEKWKFQPGKDRLKICSYHSYKGWESSHIILLLEGIGEGDKRIKEMTNALFISLTRVNAFSNSRSFTCINNCIDFQYLSDYF
ncbi:hypothetical protein T458_12795 [Brevibacillus panacihumi W25]|uniref:NERD domain-containing protein n=1 Tax=Brevibacillus panacihumi W25 TaxID=1408254 RepID=V6M6N0_9BACL|nr:NERD domain-containing protein/DEAD/DEAH box helicase [Brevibacillus panacihumi]EST54236.1 hypothetical protein T458_12795 [Brevibacillus panacihumi W25]